MTCKIHPESYDEIIERNWPEGVKKTKKRVDIFKVLYTSQEPLSAAEIFTQLNQAHPSEMYAFSTIYRNLIAFEKAGIVGLIPNCAASVIITELYLDQMITLGTMMSGLLVSAGIGLLVLFRVNDDKKENINITLLLFFTGTVVGLLIDLIGITI